MREKIKECKDFLQKNPQIVLGLCAMFGLLQKMLLPT